METKTLTKQSITVGDFTLEWKDEDHVIITRCWGHEEHKHISECVIAGGDLETLLSTLFTVTDVVFDVGGNLESRLVNLSKRQYERDILKL